MANSSVLPFRFLLLLAITLPLMGCGSDQVPTYPVRGKVQFDDGVPVRNGTIELESVEHGTTATGTIQSDGSFVLGTYTEDDGAAAGEHTAIVVQLVIADGAFKHTVDHGRPVPPKFADYESSPLKVTVEPKPQNEITVTIPRNPS